MLRIQSRVNDAENPELRESNDVELLSYRSYGGITMRKSRCSLTIATLVFAVACSGGPTTPPAPEPELNLTADDVAFVEGTDVGGGLEASGTVVGVRFGDPIGVSGRARGRWQMSVVKEGDRHRVRGELSLRARTADGETIGVRARISRAALRDDGEALRFAGVARVYNDDAGHAARLRGTVIDDGRIRLQFVFRGGGEGQIVGRVEEFEVR